LLVLGLLFIVLSFVPAHAAEPLEVYGKLPSIEAPRLSPDGTTMAFLSSIKGRRCLVIHHLDKQGPDAGRAVCPGNYEVRSFAWKNPDRLIVEVYTQGQSHGEELRTQSKLVAIDTNGRNAVPLVEPANERAVDFGQDRVIDM